MAINISFATQTSLEYLLNSLSVFEFIDLAKEVIEIGKRNPKDSH